MVMNMNTSKREFLGRAVGLSAGVAVSVVLGYRNVFAAAEDVQKAIDAFAGGKTPAEGVITLTTPEIAENGNSVPVSVSVESPMTEDDYVESVMILAEDNPSALVATFHFTPASGEAMASTRMRLARTQNVLAIARMSNGDVYTATNNIKVTIGGCGG
jgi:sulfur-oxidizing protein SoxY